MPPRERYDEHGQDTWVTDEERATRAELVPGADEFHRPPAWFCEVCGKDLKARPTCPFCGDDE